ncbi:MAG: CopG family transcriptional regulator [Anaerolineae bacterium]|uniref:CopG family transcriptional regulator n=1 Tax=Promineifilum sp. TaxID=2664178 RepID=UPI001D9B8F30|nr:antitoxin [Anaerolineales bacterium]MCB8935326.1 CopG family transcriptional regulator [Promineifilum sp.]MCO5180387.1 ribbon-helix-helix domain-containing protein [Promineifilum sp.]MCW5846568.1 CopG family transcriptional regulator [Anaerolineae bacterium]
MRTTLDLDEDILSAAKEIAHRRGESIGRVLSELAREALTQQTATTNRNGIPLFPVREQATLVTLELVNQLRDEAD